MTTVEYFAEICCELCQGIIHNHLKECINCDATRPDTDAYAPTTTGETIKCDHCGQEYEVQKPAHLRGNGTAKVIEEQRDNSE